MSEKAETRAAQSAKDSRATTAKVSNLEGRVAWLEQDAPEPMPMLPKHTERVEQQDVVIPQSWQVRALDTTDRSDENNVVYKAEFQIYNPVLFFGGVPKKIAGFGTGWTKLYDETPLSASRDVVARVTYKVDAEGERSFKEAEIVVKGVGEQTPNAEEGEAIDDIEIATLHSSGWDAITQHQAGPIYLGGGSGGGGTAVNPEDFNIYITKIGEEVWLTQGQKTTTTTSGTTYEPIRKVLRLDDLLYKAVISNFTDPNCSKEFCAVAALPMCFGSLGRVDKQGQVNVDVSGATWKPAAADILLRGYETTWMKTLCAAYPESDTDQGFLEGMSASGLFFSNDEPKDGGSEVYFYTELLDTNAARTYEST